MRVAPATSAARVVEATFILEKLQRRMARLSPRDKDYEDNRHALQKAIRELRRVIAANVQ